MSKRILIVDDQPSDLETMKAILERKGYEVDIAKDGVKALKLIKKKQFDLILVDIIMPKLSGYELTKIIRGKYPNNQKIVYISIVPEGEANLENVDDFIQKPFSPRKFLDKVKQSLE